MRSLEMGSAGCAATAGSPPAAESTARSGWEWLPVAVLLALVPVYLLSPQGGGASRFAFYIGLGLIPGCVWRVAGGSSWKIHRIFFALSLVAFVMANPALRPDRDTLQRLAGNWRMVALGFAVSFLQPLCGTLRSHRLLLDSGVRLSRLKSFKLFLIGSFFSMFLPGSTGGDTYRVYALTNGYKKKLAPAITSITLDRLLGLPSLILIVAFGMMLDYNFFLANPVLSGTIPLISGLGAVCLALVLYLVLAGKIRRRADWGRLDENDSPPGWLRRAHLMIATNVKQPSTLPLTLLYGLLGNIACVLACQCFATALGVGGVPAVRYYLIVPLVMTINSLPGAPGGVGQGELAMAAFLDLAGPGFDNARAGVMVMLLFRLAGMAVGLAGGVIYCTGKFDFTGIEHESQGLTRLFRREAGRIPLVDMSYARVLVVDDIATNLDVAKGMLAPYGITVDCAGGGRQAVEMIRAGNPRYSAVFMDYMMPGLDGIEATRIIREEIGTDYAKKIPIIALTSADEREGTFLGSGFQAFVAKPADVEKLDAVLQALVRNKVFERKLPSGEKAAPSPAAGGKPSMLAGTAIAGVDMQRGLARFGGNEDVFIKVLRSYAVHTPPLLTKMRTFLSAGNFQDYNISVHGIKGSSYGVFATEVGLAAEQLEKNVKAGDFAAVRAGHPAFERSAEKLLTDIDRALAGVDAAVAAEKPILPAPDPEAMARLREAAGRFDLDGMEKELTRLEASRYEAGGELVLRLRGQVDSMMFEEIACGE